MRKQVREISSLCNVVYLRQKHPKGLGHAVLMSRDLVDEEPFAVVLSDDVIDAQVPCLKQMTEVLTNSTPAFWPLNECRSQPPAATASLLRRVRRFQLEWTIVQGEGPG